MKASDNIIMRIRLWEGFRSKAYACPAGVLTIGYGHTGPDVVPGMKITALTAAKLLCADVQSVAQRLEVLLSPKLVATLTQGQFDALVSLVFNIGMANFSKSTLLRKLRADAHDTSICREFLRWVHAGGRKLKGLEARRVDEASMYFGCSHQALAKAYAENKIDDFIKTL